MVNRASQTLYPPSRFSVFGPCPAPPFYDMEITLFPPSSPGFFTLVAAECLDEANVRISLFFFRVFFFLGFTPLPRSFSRRFFLLDPDCFFSLWWRAGMTFLEGFSLVCASGLSASFFSFFLWPCSGFPFIFFAGQGGWLVPFFLSRDRSLSPLFSILPLSSLQLGPLF